MEYQRFGLTTLVLGNTDFVPISEQEFCEIKVALDCLGQCLFVEEKYDFIVQNYAELTKAYERSKELCISARPESEYRYDKSELNRHVVNLLTTTRMYIDQAKRYGKKINRLTGHCVLDFEAKFKVQYDEKLGYRVMEQLRNFVQHRGDAVHNVTYEAYKHYVDEQMQIKQRVEAYVNPDQLAKDKKFNSEVLCELKSLPKGGNLQDFTNEFLHGLAVVHSYFREQMRGHNEIAESIVNRTITTYKRTLGDTGSTVALAAIERNTTGNTVATLAILATAIKQRKFYEEKNRVE